MRQVLRVKGATGGKAAAPGEQSWEAIAILRLVMADLRPQLDCIQGHCNMLLILMLGLPRCICESISQERLACESAN